MLGIYGATQASRKRVPRGNSVVGCTGRLNTHRAWSACAPTNQRRKNYPSNESRSSSVLNKPRVTKSTTVFRTSLKEAAPAAYRIYFVVFLVYSCVVNLNVLLISTSRSPRGVKGHGKTKTKQTTYLGYTGHTEHKKELGDKALAIRFICILCFCTGT